MTDLIMCPHFSSCPGCSSWLVPIKTQIVQKKQIVFEQLRPYLARENSIESAAAIECFSVGSGHHRVWFDLQFSKNGLGLINKDREIVPIQSCFLMSTPLQDLFSQLLKLKYPDKKISARLRVSPERKFGLWLDLSNVDVKELLIEKHFLNQLADRVEIVEIGQKRKKLFREVRPDQQFKLIEPELKPWFQTLGIPLYSTVGSFTQPSWASADFMTSLILEWSLNQKKITEYGSGIGQYTVPLLRNNYYVTVHENNPLAVSALKINTKEFAQGLVLNPQNQTEADLFLVNPPRSGLGDFAFKVLNSEVSRVIYISCSVESLSKDLAVLKEKYQVIDFKIVDQFPHSKHFETCVLLQKISS